MTLHRLRITDAKELAGALSALGADSRSLPYFDNKRSIECLFVPDADVRAANVMKQEMLSLGGDAAVNAHTVDCRADKSSVLLFGSVRQLSQFADKLNEMPWWGFPKISAGVREALANLRPRARTVKLPCGAGLEFGRRTLVMGIINLTDDSFYAASRTGGDAEAAAEKALKMAAEGADLLDLGAESTRPGSDRVPEEQERKRMAAAVRAIRKSLPQMPLSIDTTRESVARAALAEGADIVNDVSGLTFEPRLAAAAAEAGALLVLMHMRGTPATMAALCDYKDLLADMTAFFDEGIGKAASFGLPRENIILDPGIGFAKTYEQNLFLLKHPEAFRTFGLPLLVGASRKGSVGKATEAPEAADRLEGTLAVSALCAWAGGDIVRVHDVLANRRAVMMAEAIRNADYE